MAYGVSKDTQALASSRDMTTIRGVDTQERIFYISPYWMKEILIRNNGTNDVQIRLSERENPITVKAGSEINIDGEFAYFLASASAKQDIDILYRPSRKLIAKRVPPVALYLDGKDDYVNCGNSESLNVRTLTLSALLKLTNREREWQYIISKSDIVTKVRGYYLLYRGITQGFRIFVGDGTNRIYTDSGTTPFIARWYDVQGTFDLTTTKIFVNGEEKGIPSGTPAIAPSPTDLFIGRYGSFYLEGVLGVARVYDRALNVREVKYNYNNPHEPIRKGLVLYLSPYSIDIVNGKWYDLSGQENHGTIYGATLKELWRPEQ